MVVQQRGASGEEACFSFLEEAMHCVSQVPDQVMAESLL
jgi:hypothetical protein